MSDVLNRHSLEILHSVNTPDYDPADWVVNPDLTPVQNVSPDFWVLEGDTLREMTQAEKDAQAAVQLPTIKFKRVNDMSNAVTAFVGQHYEPARQIMLTALLAEAAAQQKQARVTYIASALAWIETSMSYFYQQAALVGAAADAAAVAAVPFDLLQFSNTDPQITIEQAMQLN